MQSTNSLPLSRRIAPSALVLPAISGARAAVGALALAALWLRISFAAGNPTLDDAWITFRYVRNLSRGLGFVYNPGEQVLGTTTPLYTLLLVPAAMAGLDIAVIGKAINLIASAGNVLLVYFLANRLFGRTPALFAALLLAITPASVWAASTGMETELNVLCLLALIWCSIENKRRAIGILAASSVILRPDDLILVVLVLGLPFLNDIRSGKLTARSTEPIALFAVCLLPWLLFATAYFGSPIPASVYGKSAAYRVPVMDNIGLYMEQFGFALYSPRAFASTVIFLLGLAQTQWRSWTAVVVPLYFAAYSTAFVFLGARLGSGWYWQPLWGPYCIIAAGGIQWLLNTLTHLPQWRRLGPSSKTGAALSLAMAVAAIWLSSVGTRFFAPKTLAELTRAEEATALESAGRWLNLYTAPNATVQVESIGAVGWFSERYLLDEGGLVSPQVQSMNLKIGTRDSIGILSTFVPDYYLAWKEDATAPLLVVARDNWFAKNYTPVAQFGPHDAPLFVLFKKSTNTLSN